MIIFLAIHKQDMEMRAKSISENASIFLNSDPGSGRGGFFKFLGEMAGTDVWLIDKDLNLITANTGHNGTGRNHYKYQDLPPNAEALVKEVFNDKISFSEDFSSLLSETTLTVGVPIKSIEDNTIIGVVLLHSAVHGVDNAIFNGFIVLSISILVALFISFFLSVGFSINFTKPLNKMNNTALCLANGDYLKKTNVRQNDEIGELANSIDILSERLLKASKESENLEKMRRDFIANISHELKTPVTVIRGSLEAILDKVVDDPDQVEIYNEQMLKESISLQRLINDLLELSKLQNPDFIIEKQELSTYELLDDVVRSASQIAVKKNININFKKDDKDKIILGDYGRLKQMFMIVIDNAIKFSEDSQQIDIICENNTIYIEDYGIGIGENELPFIFERFHKSRLDQNKSGTGLGLAIAKQIADRHNISIEVVSFQKKGTKFEFKMP